MGGRYHTREGLATIDAGRAAVVDSRPMGLLRRLERALERGLDAVGGLLGAGGLSERQLERIVADEVDTTRGPEGRPVLLNTFAVHVASANLASFRSAPDELVRRLEAAIIAAAEARGLPFPVGLDVRLSGDPEQAPGSARVEASWQGRPPRLELLNLRSARRHVVVGPSVVVGQAPTCGIVLPSEYVSREHARLSLVGDGWRVTDLGSSNGTKINGARVREADLRNNDTLALGPLVFRVEVR
ncbi:MAG TPA: hypothetical protein DCZ72_03940 [Armatimonadetes bacterium]|nr:hypothetical protein [Armatimonadota bacterium]